MSKYASLPDIDSSGTDVFETADVPIQSTYNNDSDSDQDHYPLASSSNSPTHSRRLLNPHSKQANNDSTTNINQDRLDTKEARDRFGKVVKDQYERNHNQKGKDRQPPSRRRLPSTSEYVVSTTSSRRRNDYRSNDSDDEGERETPLEKLRRLRMEVMELEDEVKLNGVELKVQSTTTTKGEGIQGGEEQDGQGSSRKEGTKEEEDTKPSRQITPAVILQQLQLLRGDLKGLEPTLGVVGESGGDDNAEKKKKEKDKGGKEPFEEKTKIVGGLLEQLDTTTTTTRSEESNVNEQASSSSSSSSSTTTDMKKVESGNNMGQLEQRLAQLEKLVGANEADVDETQTIPLPLIPTISRLDHLLSLLTQPRHLDSISRRVKVLVGDLERIHESRRKLGDTRPLNVAIGSGLSTMTLSTTTASGSNSNVPSTTTTTTNPTQLPPDALQKIDHLFTLVPRLEPLLPLAPRLLSRLRSLSTLHSHAHDFQTKLDDMTRELSRLGEEEEGLREVFEGLRASFEENGKKGKENVEGLMKRLEEVAKRLDRLEVDS